MKGPRLTFRQWVGWTGFAVVFLVTAAALVWRGDILRAGLDPQVPFQTYEPPAAPDYAARDAWALWDATTPGAGDAPVFFLHSTTYEGGGEWIDSVGPDRELAERVLPNYAGPFAAAGPVSAPRYRQASLYTRLSLADDSRQARAFAYRDAAAAFQVWLGAHPHGPVVLVGVEQGAELLARLLQDIARDPALSRRVAAVYLIDAVVAAGDLPPSLPGCARRDQASCVVAYADVSDDGESGRRRLRRALVWDERGRLVELAGRPALCVNPITGSQAPGRTPVRAHGGATNATGLEWEARPALQGGLITAECRDGLLRHSPARGESFRKPQSWVEQQKVDPFNLFYGDLERDVQARIAAWRSQSDVRASRQSNSASST